MANYEYMLHTWGGFYNEENLIRHGYRPGYYWFDTADEREKYISELRGAEREFDAHALAFTVEEGTQTRINTLAEIVFSYKGEDYLLAYDFGFAYKPSDAEYMFTDGNYGCDCNRSLFLARKYAGFPELDCGQEIAMKSFEVFRFSGPAVPFLEGD